MSSPAEQELIALTQRLLESIATGDWNTYAALCDESLTCFEPEAGTHLVQGMPFHKFYFDLPSPSQPRNTTIVSPHVRLMGDVAVVSYVRLVQRLDSAGAPCTAMFSETRVWQQRPSGWKHVHFHRS